MRYVGDYGDAGRMKGEMLDNSYTEAGAEMIAASDWGLGWVIFDSKEFLSTNIMLAALAVIGIIGFLFERFVLSRLERVTVNRWGMVHQARDKE